MKYPSLSRPTFCRSTYNLRAEECLLGNCKVRSLGWTRIDMHRQESSYLTVLYGSYVDGRNQEWTPWKANWLPPRDSRIRISKGLQPFSVVVLTKIRTVVVRPLYAACSDSQPRTGVRGHTSRLASMWDWIQSATSSSTQYAPAPPALLARGTSPLRSGGRCVRWKWVSVQVWC